MKYGISLGVSTSIELKEIRELLVTLIQKVDEMLVAQKAQAASNLTEAQSIEYYLPFSSNDDLEDFMKQDADFHRRKISLREVRFLIKYLKVQYLFCY